MNRFIYIIHNRALKEKRWILRKGIQNDQASEVFIHWDLPLNMGILYPLLLIQESHSGRRATSAESLLPVQGGLCRAPSVQAGTLVKVSAGHSARQCHGCFGQMIHILISFFPTCSTPTVDYSASAAVWSRSGYVWYLIHPFSLL